MNSLLEVIIMSGSYKELRKKAVAEEFSSPELMNMRKKLAVCFIKATLHN